MTMQNNVLISFRTQADLALVVELYKAVGWLDPTAEVCMPHEPISPYYTELKSLDIHYERPIDRPSLNINILTRMLIQNGITWDAQ